MNEQYEVYIDSDGVICDFEKKVSEIGKMEFHKISKGYMWKLIRDHDANVEPFFESLAKMADADILWEYLKNRFINIQILTACGTTPANAAEQKRKWYAKNFGPEVVVKVVAGSGDKAKYAKPKFAGKKHILIDDRMKSLNPWIEAGGIGILHTDAKTTIEKLEKLLSSS